MTRFGVEGRGADVERFADRVARFLDRRAGLPFCDACVAEETGLPVTDTRAGMARLSSGPGFLKSYQWCARCLRIAETIERARRPQRA